MLVSAWILYIFESDWHKFCLSVYEFYILLMVSGIFLQALTSFLLVSEWKKYTGPAKPDQIIWFDLIVDKVFAWQWIKSGLKNEKKRSKMFVIEKQNACQWRFFLFFRSTDKQKACQWINLYTFSYLTCILLVNNKIRHIFASSDKLFACHLLVILVIDKQKCLSVWFYLSQYDFFLNWQAFCLSVD